MESFDQVAEPRMQARELFEQAFERQRNREFDSALELYQESIRIHASAEAYTFMGWTYSFLGDYEKAIRSCHKAIEVDPDLGNPYNDIGAYLIEMGRFEDAIIWLKKATRAPRYSCHHYPWYNLGKVFELLGRTQRAKECYARSVRANKSYPLAVRALMRVLSQLN